MTEDDTAIAEIVNKHGDPEGFAERELVVLHNIQKLPIGTTLHARLPQRESLPEIWTQVRDSLMAVVLEGAQAEIDEVDAQLLVGLIDQRAALAPILDELTTLRLRLQDADAFSRAVHRQRPVVWQVAMVDVCGPGEYHPPPAPKAASA